MYFKMEVKPAFHQTENKLLETRFQVRINNKQWHQQFIEPAKLYTDSVIDMLYDQAKEEMKKRIREERKP